MVQGRSMVAMLLAGIAGTCSSDPDCEVGVTLSGWGTGDGNYMRPNWEGSPRFFSTYTNWQSTLPPEGSRPDRMITFVSQSSLQDPLKYLPGASKYMNKWIYFESSLPYDQGLPFSRLKIHAVCESGCQDVMWPQHGVLQTQWRMLDNGNSTKFVNVTGECCKRNRQCDDVSCWGLPFKGCLHKSKCCDTTWDPYHGTILGCHKLKLPFECADPSAALSSSTEQHGSKSASMLV